MNWLKRGLLKFLGYELLASGRAVVEAVTEPVSHFAADLVAADAINPLDELKVKYGFSYERQVMPDRTVRITAFFPNGDAVVGLGNTTVDAVDRLRARLEVK